MNTSTAVLAGLALVAAAIYAGGSTRMGESFTARAADSDAEASGKGVWAFRGHGAQIVVWKMNTMNGDLYACTQSSNECTKVEVK